MPRFLDMLRAKNIFGNPRGGSPLGMPDIDDGNVAAMFRSVVPLASSLKNDDFRRQKELMEFEASLRNRQQAPRAPVSAPIMPQKKNVVYGGIHPPTQLQQQFRQDDVAARGQRDRMATQAGALNSALITGRQTDDADMAQKVAEINGRENVARMNKELAAKAADEARTDKAKTDEIARTQKGPLTNVINPKTNQMESRQFNPVTRKYEAITLDDTQAGTGYKQGTIPKPTTNAGQDPVKLAALRKTTQSTMDELDELLDPKTDTLRSHASDATGKSGMLGKWSENLGLSSLTPETTRGRAGINALKGKLVLNLIGEMKSQSKTGATGFGALNRAELAILEQSASKLDPNLSDEAFAAELRTVRKKLQMIMEDAQGDTSSGDSDADKKADDYMRRKGLM